MDKQYTILLLDADDTIFDFHAAERIAFFAMMEQMGIPADDEMHAVYSIINEQHWKALERGELTREQVLVGRYARLAERFGLQNDPAEMNRCYLQNLSRQTILFDDSMEAMRMLSQNHRIYIVTNGNAMVQHGRFANSPVMQYVDGYFISGEIGYEKPDMRYFEAVFAAIPDFDKKKTLLAGDSATSDLQGAINAGLDSCYVDRRSKPLPDGISPTYRVSDLMELARLLN